MSSSATCMLRAAIQRKLALQPGGNSATRAAGQWRRLAPDCWGHLVATGAFCACAPRAQAVA